MAKAGRSTARSDISAKTAALAEQMLHDLSLIRRAVRRPLQQQIAQGGLTAPQQAAMHVIVSSEGTSLKELSTAMSLAHSTVSGIVDRLERRGMIERRLDEKDGRITRLYPTRVVTQFVREQMPLLERGPLAQALEKVSAAERDQIGHAIRRLRELLESAESESA